MTWRLAIALLIIAAGCLAYLYIAYRRAVCAMDEDDDAAASS